MQSPSNDKEHWYTTLSASALTRRHVALLTASFAGLLIFVLLFLTSFYNEPKIWCGLGQCELGNPLYLSCESPRSRLPKEPWNLDENPFDTLAFPPSLLENLQSEKLANDAALFMSEQVLVRTLVDQESTRRPRVLIVGQRVRNIDQFQPDLLAKWQGAGQAGWANFLYLAQLGFDTYYYVDEPMEYPRKTIEQFPDGKIFQDTRENMEKRIAAHEWDFIVLQALNLHSALEHAPFVARGENNVVLVDLCASANASPNNERMRDFVTRNKIVAIGLHNYQAKLEFDENFNGYMVPTYVNQFGILLEQNMFQQEPTPEYEGAIVFMGEIRAPEPFLDVFHQLGRDFPDRDVLVISGVRGPVPGETKSRIGTTEEWFCRKEGCPKNLKLLHVPRGDERAKQILNSAAVAIDFSWHPDWYHDNSKLQSYIGHGLPVVTNRPAQTYRWLALTGHGEVLGNWDFYKPEAWSQAVQRVLDRDLAKHRFRVRSLMSYIYGWQRHVYEIFQVLHGYMELHPRQFLCKEEV
eukprot:Clim_evm46s239 gene=Clim_evmTU46s239